MAIGDLNIFVGQSAGSPSEPGAFGVTSSSCGGPGAVGVPAGAVAVRVFNSPEEEREWEQLRHDLDGLEAGFAAYDKAHPIRRWLGRLGFIDYARERGHAIASANPNTSERQ